MKLTIDKILGNTLITILAIMLLSVVWQVFTRFVLQAPSTITDEITSFSLIWIGLLGAAYATGQNLHLAIDLLPSKMVEKRIALYDGFVYLAVFLFSFCVMIIGGIRLCALTFQFEQTSASLEIPLGIVYLVVPLSGVLICYYSVYTFMETLQANKKTTLETKNTTSL